MVFIALVWFQIVWFRPLNCFSDLWCPMTPVSTDSREKQSTSQFLVSRIEGGDLIFFHS